MDFPQQAPDDDGDRVEPVATHREVPAGSEATEQAASCPLGLAINTIGGRWKLHVLRTLLLSGPHRYNGLLRGIDGISPKELTRNLRELEAARLVELIGQDGARLYSLTPLGQELDAPFRALGMFGARLSDYRVNRAQ
jgi:DNA-binding HxlR family transcriptional regulator